ncbi:hypothetical protein CBR_g2685 [Chara braunii]|uniref:Myb/SANT-like DNA-binding domain-containing protein n=1 Tax=Chara braunii TaxID=69332 RepID=A0A388KDK0_CHABU|nr:hypothetical protein CBR_g2685 [Chara braunii]|eukprot:GBG68134.1 hypothetical protein CBR_g2685 [Chara braunii]
MHLAGLRHNYRRMRTKEWKWEDIAKRMANAGRPKDADDCMKKWDNIFQNYKKIQRFQNSSGRPDFFRLSNEERKEYNFKFRMERALYNEIHIGMVGNHTIFPLNIADAGSPDGVHLPRRGAGAGESVGSEGAGEGLPEERSTTRDSDSNAASGAGGEDRSSVYHVHVVVVTPQPHGRPFSRETYFSPGRPHFPLVRSHCQARLQRSPQNTSTQGNTRGKKRDVVIDDSQEQGRGRRQAPKAKRVRTEDALPRVRGRGAQGWAGEVEGDCDDEFTAEEEQAEATTSEVRESDRQRSSDSTASKRMQTPPHEAQQLRGRETWTEKAPVVDLGGDDDEPLERRRIRIRTTATPPPEVVVRVATNNRPVSGRLPATPSQPHQRNDAGDGGSVQRVGGGEVVADARTVGAQVAGVVGAVGSGNVGTVATGREDAEVVATAREEARGKRKVEGEAGEAGSSRPRRSVMTKDLIDCVVLWVDDKAFWTTGEGRRLYNIVHETKDYFVAIASGLPAPDVPRSVVLPKASTRVARIVDQSQLQQAISRAAAVENVALCILHGWVFKSGNRPRGYHVAFQYSLESFATDIARAMWYGEEWCEVVSPAICAHTIDLSMDLPLWFAGANIEDRPEDDDMAAHQESTVIRVAYAFRVAVQMGALIDGEFISHDRLSRVADCFRLLLAACMWIMRMAGDDPRSHYEAFNFVDLVAKPTLVAAMHRSFDHRRSIVRAAKVVTDRLGKATATFGQYPNYIPQWAPCGIAFRHDASITGTEDAKKLDRLGLGPPDDDNNDDGKDDA